MQGKGVLFAHRSPLEPAYMLLDMVLSAHRSPLELAYMLLDMGDPEVK